MLTPLLTAFGVDIREAIAVGSVSVVAISCTASPSFLRHHLPNLKAGAFLEFFAIAGAMIGAVLTHLFIIGGSPAAPIMLLAATTTIAWARRGGR